jgi:hypothetical protein
VVGLVGATGKPQRFESQHESGGKELKPLPIGKFCNQLCPFFKCSKNSLVFVNKVVKGHVQKSAMCRWIGDQCLGYKCQFVFCERKALLPNGVCTLAIRFSEGADDFLKEVEKYDIGGGKVKDILGRRTGRKDIYLE